jgi:hypothetical protein
VTEQCEKLGLPPADGKVPSQGEWAKATTLAVRPAPAGAFVQFTALRNNHVDHICGTGAWACLQVKDVPVDVARRLLRFHDTYSVPGTVDGPVEVVVFDTSEQEAQSKLYETLNAISLMDRDAAQTFIYNNFGQTIKLNEYTDDSARAYARQCFDLYGLRQ